MLFFTKTKEMKEEYDSKYDEFQRHMMKQFEEKKQEMKRITDEQLDAVSNYFQNLNYCKRNHKN